jgi:hypothetical protein
MNSIKAIAESEHDVRRHAEKYYGKLWCSVYEEKPSETVIGETLYFGRLALGKSAFILGKEKRDEKQNRHT